MPLPRAPLAQMARVMTRQAQVLEVHVVPLPLAHVVHVRVLLMHAQPVQAPCLYLQRRPRLRRRRPRHRLRLLRLLQVP